MTLSVVLQSKEVTHLSQAMLIKVLSMTPEQINMLAPAERANIIQLVSIHLPELLSCISHDHFQRASLG